MFSNAQEVEIFINGRSAGRKPVDRERPLPNSASFVAAFEPGTVEAVSYTDGREVSRAILATTGNPAGKRILAEKTGMKADGHDLIYAEIRIVDQDGNTVPDAEVPLAVHLTGPALLAGFGTGNPVTDEDYTDNETTSFRGKAAVILRAGYEPGRILLTVEGKGLPTEKLELDAE